MCSFTLWQAIEVLLLRTHSPVKGRAVASGPSSSRLRQQAAKLSALLLIANAGDLTLSALA